MASEFIGAIDDNGAYGPVIVQRNERLYYNAVMSGIEEFVGDLRLERSLNGGLSWETALDDDGAAQVIDGTPGPLTETIVNKTILNDSNTVAWYRVLVTGFDGDNAALTLSQADNDVLEVVVRDSKNRPLISATDDGGLVFHGVIGGLGEDGDLEVRGALTADVVETPEVDGVTVVARGEGWTEYVKNLVISAADIVATGAGKFGHAAGYPLVADPGAGFLVELVSCLMRNDRATAAYTDGGNITINRNGGAAITGLVSAANSLGAATDTRSLFTPLAAAAEVMAANKGLNLVASAAFTNPGTAAGVLEIRIRYRVHADTL